jgi:adenosylcobinamide-GDP ribazoletransferase
VRRRWAELVLGFMLLTRLPMPALAQLPPAGGGMWAFPVVGGVIGALGGLAYAVALRLGLPVPLATAWALAAQLLVTGALHEDGLADMADGFGGGRDRQRKLEIMRDSRIGSYGVLALLLALGMRAAAMVELHDPVSVAAALAVAGALGRAAMLGVLAALQPARQDGLAAGLGRPDRGALLVGGGLATLAALVLLPAPLASVAVLLAAGCAAGMARLAWRQVGGHTGDVLGATAQVTECVVLTALAAGLVG